MSMMVTKMEQDRRKARDEYLVTQVSTASPAQLTLMLFDGADRYLQAAVALLQGGLSLETTPVVTEALGRAGSIVSELLSSLDTETWPEGTQLAALYTWIADELTQVNITKRVLTASSPVGDRARNEALAARTEAARVTLAEVADAFRQARQDAR